MKLGGTMQGATLRGVPSYVGMTGEQIRREQYLAYMNSPKWWIKRHVTLFLAGWRPKGWPGGARRAVCQIHKLNEQKFGRCHSRRLVQVHHLTYRRFGKERIRDRLAVCKHHHPAADRERLRQKELRRL